jgi:biopolymer transport protein ExbB
MTKSIFSIVLCSVVCSAVVYAQDTLDESSTAFGKAALSIQQKLESSVSELNALRERMAEETIPLSQKLSALESELAKTRLDYQQTTRMLDSRTLDLSNLRTEIKSRQEEASYVSNLLSEYIRNFESRLHISEIQRYAEPLETAKLALENSQLPKKEVFQAQADVVATSIDHYQEALGGTRFEGSAVDPSGLLKQGTFVVVGPAALFQSSDGEVIGTAEQRLGSLQPAVVPFGTEEDTQVAKQFMAGSGGAFLLDPTLGNAHKIEETRESLLDHIKKGGVVMIPIFSLAGAAFLVALWKWLGMLFTRTPSQRKVKALLTAVASRDRQAIQQKANCIKGPVGAMLQAGVEHLDEPRELIEEVMYEKMLSSRLKLERFLPFIAISASSAPLLGLLGTVTGIINTFKLITVFGSGDVKTLSGGISEALITTEFGLIVAIPSLLIHAFLSRKAKGVVNQMEKAAVALMNQISKTPCHRNAVQANVAANPIQSNTDTLPPLISHPQTARPTLDKDALKESVAGSMNQKVFSLSKHLTVSEAIYKIRLADIHEKIDSVFVVDENGKYLGHVPIGYLLTRSENTLVESLLDGQPRFVRIDTPQHEFEHSFTGYDLSHVPVLDHDDLLVGQVSCGSCAKVRVNS